jgi:hypothetical protein
MATRRLPVGRDSLSVLGANGGGGLRASIKTPVVTPGVSVERLGIGRGQRRGAARDLVLAADSTARSVAKAFSMRRMRVSDFFALSIARTCSNLRL